MCGILGFVSKKEKPDPASFLIDGLKRLEYRGYDSWGIAFGRDPVVYKAVGKVADISSGRLSLFADHRPASVGLAHTRWATHGGVTRENAHPHLDCTGKIVVAHNGIIENWEELKDGLLRRGHRFKSETDTEVVAHLIEEAVGSQFRRSGVGAASGLANAVRAVFNQLRGLNAVVAFFPEAQMIVAFRNGSPLIVGVGREEHYVASDIPAFLPYTRKVVFLEDGEGVVLTRDGVKIIDAAGGGEREATVEEVGWGAGEADKGEYPHFLIKEIEEQPQVLSRLAEYPERDLKGVSSLIKNAFGTYLTACGTAAYSGLAATYFFSKIAKKHVNFAVGSEFYFLEDFLTSKSLLIAASQSGETMDTLEAVRAAKRRRAKVAALTNVPGSSLTRLADETLLLNCGPEKAVLATKSYTAKLAVFLLLAYQLDNRLSDGREVISKAAEGISDLLTKGYERMVEEIAKGLKDVDHIYVIGRGVNYATALEAALKIKEVSYIHAEGFAGGELKHGVIALIEKGTPCLVFVADDETKSSVLSNAEELKSRGGLIIGVSPEKSEVFDEWIEVPDAGWASPIVNAVPAQLLAYRLAIERGLDPDRPRNLAKSVTVK